MTEKSQGLFRQSHDGFHTRVTSEIVKEAPFILVGPQVKRGGPKDLLQIDLAPTLSLLAGVSPFYDSPALPALDMLNNSPDVNSVMLSVFPRVITGISTPLALDYLREKRLALVGRKASHLTGVLVILSTVLSAALLAYVALFESDREWGLHSRAMLIGGGMLGLCSLIGMAVYLSVPEAIASRLPFNAKFIFGHPLGVTLALVLLWALAMLSARIVGKKDSMVEEGLLTFLFTLVFVLIFLSGNPYGPLNWALVIIPLAAWGVSRRPAWMGLFGAFIFGLAIRRLSTYAILANVPIPDRWQLSAAVLAVGLAVIWRRLRAEQRKWGALGLGVVLFLPGIVSMAWPKTVEFRALLLLLGLIPVAMVSRRKSKAQDVYLAMWVVFFYLGTSSHINLAMHIAAFPLLIAVWAAAREASSMTKGVLVGLLIWDLYVLPVNMFDLRLAELTDPFILGSLTFEHL